MTDEHLRLAQLLVVVLSTSGLTGAVVAWRQDRRAARSARQLAERAEVDTDRADLDLAVLMRRMARDEVAAVYRELAELRSQVERLESCWDAARQYIVELLTWIGMHVPDQAPPAPPESLGIRHRTVRGQRPST